MATTRTSSAARSREVNNAEQGNDTSSSVLVIGNHYWGHGDDLAAAKRNFCTHGGQLSNGYSVLEFPSGVRFDGVDQFGRVFWTGEGRPTIREVPPRKRATQ